MKLPFPKPPWSQTGKEIESLMRKAIGVYSLFDGVKKVAVALSGGKDSLTLLYMLDAVRGYGVADFELCAVHVDGAFSCGPGIAKKFLEPICEEMGIEWMSKVGEQELEKLECYGCSRQRRRLIFEGAKEMGATTIAFGHHRDDSNGTLLMNLLQKGEFAANLPKVPMVDYGITIVRPLILVPEDKIKVFAQQNEFARITCQCPVGQNSKRKQVNDLVKEMEALFPHVRENLAHAARLYGSTKALDK